MPFFDPTQCPDCRAPLPAPSIALRCHRCGLALGSAGGLRLAALLREADQVLSQLRRDRMVPPPRSAPWTYPSSFTSPAFTTAAPATPPAAAPDRAPVTNTPIWPGQTRPRGQWSLNPAALLLGLGALCLVVAAVVFLSVSWTALTLGQKVAVLGGVTALLGAGAAWAIGKDLRGSGETLLAIAFADLTLDLLAARQADLLGLRSLPPHLFTGLAAGLVAVTAAASLLAARRFLAPQLTVALAGSSAIYSLLAGLSWPGWIVQSLAVAGIGGLALAGRRFGLSWTERLAGGVSALPWLALVADGGDQILTGRYAHQLWSGRAFELPAAAALALLAAAAPTLLGVVRIRVVVALSGLAAFEIVLVATADSYLPLAAALALGLTIAAALGLVRVPVWSAAAAILWAGLAVLSGLVLSVAAAAGLAISFDPERWVWRAAAGHQLHGWAPGAPTAQLALLVALAGATALHWAASRPWLPAAVAVLAVTVSLNWHPSVLIATGAWLAVGALTAASARRAEQLGLAAIALGAGLLTGLPSDLTTGSACLVGAILLVGFGRRWVEAELGALALAMVAVTGFVHAITPADGTPAVAGLLAGAAVSAVLAQRSPSRHWWQWIAFACITGAIWIEAAVHQVHAPELYCVPLGVVVLGFGHHQARRRALSSWLSYGPGLLVLTAPTAVLALSQPLSWRAGAAGAAALILLLSGSRLRQQSTLLIGAIELSLLVLRELGPYALALPRWAGIAAVGVILLSTGITWENRLGNLRQLRRQLAQLR